MLFVISCSNNGSNAEQQEIAKMEKKLYESQSIDPAQGQAMMEAYQKYAKGHPADTLSPEYLFKAGEIAMNLNMATQAIVYFDQIIDKYSSFSKMPECLFLKAFVCENQLSDLVKAEQLYKEFLERFPDHILAKDARASLQYLGKSPEELIRLFEEKAKQEANN